MRDLGRDEYSYKVERDHLADDTPCSGCGCDTPHRYDTLAPIGDCSLTPGDASPAGRCPECDGLAYPLNTRGERLEAIARDMLAYEAARFDAEPIGYQSDGFGQVMHDTREEAEAAAAIKGFRPDTVEPVYGDLNVSGADLVDAFAEWRDQLREALNHA